MKVIKAFISVVFIVGTIAIIIYDGKADKHDKAAAKSDSVKIPTK